MKVYKVRFVIHTGDKHGLIIDKRDKIIEKLFGTKEAAQKFQDQHYEAAFLLGITDMVSTSISELDLES